MMVNAKLKTVGIDHAVLHVSQLERSKEFYVGLLGMKVLHENSWNSFLSCGSQVVALFQVAEGTSVKTGSELNHLALRLESGSYEDVKRTLEAHGCQVSGRPGNDRCLYFNDPDGHRLQVLLPGED